MNDQEKETKYEFFNGFGGFKEDGKEYEVLLEGENKPPVPWINVIANKEFGFHISESGASYTWANNSRENKITPWSNDPVSDIPSEVIYIFDEVTGRVITPFSYGRSDRGVYKVRHGFGYSMFLHEEDSLEQEVTVFTPLEDSVKIWDIKLTNHSDNVKYLTLTYYVEWVLGINREDTNPYIVTFYNNEYEYLSAKNVYRVHFSNNMAFMFSSEMIRGYTGDRHEFLGRKGSVLHPQGLDGKLSNRTGAGLDSCGTIQISVTVNPGEEKSVLFGLGSSDNTLQIQTLKSKYQDMNASLQELNRVKDYWTKILGTLQIRTNDREMDILVNGWLLYQTISCRINARAAFYQCGGAYGFRDQLQDSLSLIFTDPAALRNQILISCSRQFEEGDVQHWWHPPTGIGVRTRITDDLLWLPYAAAAYIDATGDDTILHEEVPYIKGPELKEGEHDIMITPQVSSISGSVYEHCKKTIQITRLGEHGLPLMGGGDWNDGMNEVGKDGKGESVWLGWFFCTVVNNFVPLCYHEGDMDFGKELEEKRTSILKSIEEHAWDGEWYLRAFYDDGTKLGSKESDECKIDSISQSWSVISKGGKKERTLTAMQSALRYLVKEQDSMSLLLSPPFNKTSKNPGYIKNYIPGNRENGGQYTHAAIWLAIAATMIEDYNMAYTLFTMLNPVHITLDKGDALRYEKEPYVMAADISFCPPYTGRGGWSWYTGSAGWMYQGLVKWFLGIRKEKDQLIIDPGTPESFGDFIVEYKYGSSFYEIRIESRSKGVLSTDELLLDNEKVMGNKIKLADDGKRHVVIV